MTTRNWPLLSEIQLETLRWVKDGANEQSPPAATYKATCVALAARDLIELDRRKGHWKAALTEGGAFYLEHGYFQGHPPTPRSVRPPKPKPTPAESRPSGSTAHESSSAATPTLDTPPSDEPAEAPPTQFVVATELRRVHPAVRAVIEAKVPVDMKGPNLRRAHLILHTLAREAQRRGWTVARSKERSADLIEIDAGDRAVSIRLRLRTKRVPHAKSAQELAREEKYGSIWGPSYDYLPTDEMILTLGSSTEYRDSVRLKLESKLPAALEAIEAASAQARAWAEERRLRDEREARRREEIARRRNLAVEYQRWVTSVEEFAEAQRKHVADVAFLAELRTRVDSVQDTERREELWRFVRWAEQHLERVDPLVAHRLPGAEPPSEGFAEWAAGDHEEEPPDWSRMLSTRSES